MRDGRRGSRVLRFTVTSALLVAPLAGCDDASNPSHLNDPAPEPAPSPIVREGPVVPEDPEPIHPNVPAQDRTTEVAPPEGQPPLVLPSDLPAVHPTVNEPRPSE